MEIIEPLSELLKEIDKEIKIGHWSDSQWKSFFDSYNSKESNYRLFLIDNLKHVYLFDSDYKQSHHEEKKKIAAFALILESRGELLAHLLKIAVASSMQRQGLAEKLLDFIIGHYKDVEKFDKIYLEVHSENHRALSLYKKFNFKTLHKCKHFYAQGTDAFKMLLNLF
ncbi:MAG: GNAT family N-acetyltransferase [Oligoflexia bacterium]|nr:GNAT family N-acetyltransferase [Oligoflexia bacterium]